MKKLFLFAMVVAAGVAFADYGYLYWDVDATGSDVTFDYAQLTADDGNGGTWADTSYLRADAGKVTAGPANSELTKDLSSYSFMVKLYDADFGLVGESESFGYSALLASIFEDMATSAATPQTFGNVSAVPEPTSGLLLLLGIAGLALRRKVGRGLRSAPEKGMARSSSGGRGATRPTVLLALLLLCGVAFGAANDAIVTFSTKGPDTYKDGQTVVRDGETYALVWTPEGATFGGFAANGTLLSSADRLIVAAPLAKGGRCPETFIEIPAADMDAYKGGTFALYLLDTRSGASGVDGENAVSASVNASGEVAKIAADGQGGTIAGGAVALSEVGVYTEIGQPKITGFKVGDATITLTVEGLEATADYFVVPGAAPNLFQPQPANPVKPVGNTLTVEKKDGENFFKVIGARKFE